MVTPRILVTGGAGYIGSHTAKLLRLDGLEPIVYDNLTTGNLSSVRWGPFVRGNVLDTPHLIQIMEQYKPVAVIHFAGSACGGELVTDPAKYYLNNVCGTQSLLDACRHAGLDKIIFSSSCATYGIPATLPIDEATPQVPVTPYGRTKLIAEHMLADYAAAFGLRYVALRYFNACGADPEGDLSEWHEPDTHLISSGPARRGRQDFALEGLRRRLPNGGWNLHTRLYSRCRSRARPRAGVPISRKGRRERGSQFGHRARFFHQGSLENNQSGYRAKCPNCDRPPARRRSAGSLRGRQPCPSDARVPTRIF